MQALIFTAALFLLLFSLTPYIPLSNILTDIPSHFILQYAIGAVLLLAAAFYWRCGIAVYMMSLAALALFLWQLFPYIDRGGNHGASPARTYKILQANTLFLQKNTNGMQQLALQENADLVVVAEVNSPMAAMLENLSHLYPHRYIYPKEFGAYGIAVLSKHPVQNAEKRFFDIAAIPAITLDVMLDDVRVTIFAIHPATPLSDIKSRDREFANIAKWAKAQKPENLLIVGDFNATPYCPALKKLARDLDLFLANEGHGLMGTYPAHHPAFLRLPIDLTLASRGIGIKDQYTGADIGSDHLPIITEIFIK